tara:strand:- start:89 stop:388 length:300 start_codon:yes stop_codon:yes gene_type:complete
MMNLKKHTQTYKRNGIYETWNFIDLAELNELASDSSFYVVSPTGVPNYMSKDDAVSLWKHNAMQHGAKPSGFTHVGKDYVQKADEKYQDQITIMGYIGT